MCANRPPGEPGTLRSGFRPRSGGRDRRGRQRPRRSAGSAARSRARSTSRRSVRKEASAVRRTLRAVEDESQRDEMNAAIRAQRERGAVPRSMLPPEDELPERPSPRPEPPTPEPEPPKRGLLDRLLG